MVHGVNSYDVTNPTDTDRHGDLLQGHVSTHNRINDLESKIDDLEGKLEYVYQFCKTLEALFNEFEKNPMAKMMLGKSMNKFAKD